MNANEHKTANRILDILELVCNNSEGFTFSEISRALNIPKSSLHPLIMTLCNRDYVRLIKGEQKYHIGESLFVLGNKYIENVDILHEIKTILKTLSFNVEETVYFGVLSGKDVLYLARSDEKTNSNSKSNLRLVSSVGYKMPAYGVGFGKALLSQFSFEELQKLYYDGLKPITQYTVKTVEELYKQCETVRMTGFAYESQESTEYVNCIAVPIKNNEKYIAGLSVATPVFRFNDKKKLIIEKELKNAQESIEKIICINKNKWYYS